MSNLDKAQKAFAFFISSEGSESSVAFDKLNKLGVSFDDVAYQAPDGSWLTRWGSIQIPFSLCQPSGHEYNSHIEEESQSNKKEEAERQHSERESAERKKYREDKRWSRQRDHDRIRSEAAEHKHYADMIEHDRQQYENRMAFDLGKGYLGSDGEYHLYTDMEWKY